MVCDYCSMLRCLVLDLAFGLCFDVRLSCCGFDYVWFAFGGLTMSCLCLFAWLGF